MQSAIMCNRSITNLTLTERRPTGRDIHKITELKLKFLDTSRLVKQNRSIPDNSFDITSPK